MESFISHNIIVIKVTSHKKWCSKNNPSLTKKAIWQTYLIIRINTSVRITSNAVFFLCNPPLPDHKDTLPSPSAVKVQRCITPILQTSSIQFRMGCQDTVFMFCALFHEWMCPCTCIYVGPSRDFFVKGDNWNYLGLKKTAEYFPLIFFPLNFLIFITFIYSKYLVGDLVNWSQGQFWPLFYYFFNASHFCSSAILSWHLFWWTIVLANLSRTFGAALQVIASCFI